MPILSTNINSRSVDLLQRPHSVSTSTVTPSHVRIFIKLYKISRTNILSRFGAKAREKSKRIVIAGVLGDQANQATTHDMCFNIVVRTAHLKSPRLMNERDLLTTPVGQIFLKFS
jgi:hypothetical protein